jgi:hypothetical protein
MKTNILTTANGLSDRDLLARLDALADRERETAAELVAHLAALDRRPSLYAAEGYSSLYSYCTQVLRLSEDAACSRIEAARACRRFPVILDRLASGELTLTAARLLGRHLTPENHQAVLARAARRSRSQIDALVAELAPPHGPRALPGAVHDRRADARQAPAPADASPPRDSGRRSRRHLRPSHYRAPGESGEEEARGRRQASSTCVYPSRDG